MIGNKSEIIERLEKQKDGIFEITKKRESSIRSMAQNRFYWSCVVDIIGNFHGMSPVETHLAIKKTFNIETTTDLSTSEFKAFIELIQDLWKTKFDCIIPDPKDIKDEESLFKILGF